MRNLLAACVDWGLSCLIFFAVVVALWQAAGWADYPWEGHYPWEGLMSGILEDTPEEAPMRVPLEVVREAYPCGDTPSVERRTEVRDKYLPLLERYPNYSGSGVGLLRDENGELTEVRGIKVYVYEEVDPDTLPPEDRIPDCLEGIPVQIRVDAPARLRPIVEEDK